MSWYLVDVLRNRFEGLAYFVTLRSVWKSCLLPSRMRGGLESEKRGTGRGEGVDE